MASSNHHRTLPKINIPPKINRHIMAAVEAVGTVHRILIKGLPHMAIPQINLLTIRTNLQVTTQTNRTHNLASRTAPIAEDMAATAATTSTAPTAECQVLAQTLRLAVQADEGVARLPNSPTCHGRQRRALEAAAQPLKRHAHSPLSRRKYLPTLHLWMLMTTPFAHPKICV